MPDIEAQNRQYEENLAEQERQTNITNRDNLYSDRMSAASSAVDSVNSQIEQERADAKLMGVDYALTDEQKSDRINDTFASMWGAGEEESLGQLMTDYGNPEGFEEFSVVRGTTGDTTGATAASDKTVATSKGAKKKTILTEEEDVLGGSTSVLGG